MHTPNIYTNKQNNNSKVKQNFTLQFTMHSTQTTSGPNRSTLDPGPPELPGEQPSRGAVPGRAAAPRHGGVLQGGLLLRGGEQGDQHRGLLRHLHRVHVQV